MERGLDSLTEYEAGIEDFDYDEIPDVCIEFLGECCLKPLSGDDVFFEFPGECCLKPLADEDPRGGPAVPLRGTAEIDRKNTAAEHETPISRENLIMPERERIVREHCFDEVAHSEDLRVRLRICELPLTRPRVARRRIAHTKPTRSYDGSRQTAAVNRF